ncbi:hypothetical protein P8452_62787 [Trifolium repens]|nr:hypothetical protein P8452_62787 [Trifolium repens]
MSRAFDQISKVNDTKELWKLAVKVDDFWTTIKSSKEYAEMIIRDIQGDSIHVVIGPEEFKKRTAEIAEFMKLKTCSISNFKLQRNEDKFKLTPHAFKLQFLSGTTVKPNEMPNIPAYFFNLMKYEDIKAMNFREDVLVDVIGAVHEIGSAQTTATTGKLNISFRIKDLGGTIMDCILWETVASKFMEYCKNRKEEGPMILIIRRARLQKPTDRFPLQISNAWTGTKLIINEDIPDINNFKNSLPADNSYATQNKMMSFSSQRFATTASGGSQMTPEDHFIQGHRILKLSDIIKLPKDEICVTVVKTLHVKSSDRGWYMLGCSSCIKETKGTEPPYHCADKHPTTDPILRYRVDVIVGQGDAKSKFVFWDNSCIDLLGSTASEVKQTMLADGVTDRLEYPLLLDEIMGRTFAFRVRWQKEWNQCSVLECKDNNVLVKRLQKELKIKINGNASQTPNTTNVQQTPSSQSKDMEIQCSQSVQQNCGDTLDDSQTVSDEKSASADFDPLKETNLTPCKRSPAKSKHDDLITEHDSQIVFGKYASADFDPLNETNLTPCKRSPTNSNHDDLLTEQQSSTRLIKTRSNKIIKTEKS